MTDFWIIHYFETTLEKLCAEQWLKNTTNCSTVPLFSLITFSEIQMFSPHKNVFHLLPKQNPVYQAKMLSNQNHKWILYKG